LAVFADTLYRSIYIWDKK